VQELHAGGRLLYVGGIWHETHSFAAGATTKADFEAHWLLEGPALADAFAGTATEAGGALSRAAALGWSAVPGFYAAALPSGIVASGTWRELKERLIRSVQEARPDAVFLSLHGAMVAEDDLDPEATLLREVRAVVGEGVPIGVTLDSHANTSPHLVHAADVVVAYDTYPHTDFAERGAEVVELLTRMAQGERFSRALVQLPLAPPVLAQGSAGEPMRSLLAEAHALERSGACAAASWMPGFPYADVERMGMSAVLISSRPPAEVKAMAERLAQAAWEGRAKFRTELVPVAEAVRRVREAPAGPIALVDVSDNVGGGSPGDGTALLRELVQQRVAGAVVTIADRESIAKLASAAPGSRVELAAGGKADGRHGDPVPLEGVVHWSGEGRFILSGRWMKGMSMDPGRVAWVETAEGVHVVITERKVPPFDAGVLTRVGIDLASARAIVVKSALAWQAAFGDVVRGAIYVDTPGICTPYAERLPFRNRRKPLWPLDDSADFSDRRVHVFGPRRGERA